MNFLNCRPRLFALLTMLALLVFATLPLRADTPIAIGATLLPAAPTYVDPVQLVLTVTSTGSGAVNGTVTYSVDLGSSQTATVTNGAGLLPLGSFAPGAHQVAYQYSGTFGSSASQTASFTVVDAPFRYVGSIQSFYSRNGFSAVAADSQNNVLITNSSENNLYKLDLQRNVSVVATTGLSSPRGIALDASDNIYIADNGNNRVVMLTPAGVQTTLPLTGLSGPTDLAFDRTFANLYVNDQGTGRVVKLNLASSVQTTVVTGIPRIRGLVVDFSGNLYFGQRYSYQDGTIFKLDNAGNITGGYFGARSGESLSRDVVGNLYFTDDYTGLNEVDTSGHLTHIDNYYGSPIGVDVAGQIYILGGYVFTPGSAAKFGNSGATGQFNGANGAPSNNTIVYQVPYQQTIASIDVSTGGNGNLSKGSPYCEQLGQCADGVSFGPYYPGLHTGYFTSTLANAATLQTNYYGVGFNSNEAFDPGTRTSIASSLTSAGGMAESEDHTLYATDPTAKKVYSLGIGGASTPVALAFTGLTQPTQLAVDGNKNVFVLDGNTRVLELTPAGVQTTVYSTSANRLATITAMSLDGSGTLFLGGSAPETGNAIIAYTTSGNEFLVGHPTALPTLLGNDGIGGIYEADATTSTLRRYTYLGGNISLAGPTTVATGFAVPSAMTVEPSGTVFLALGSAGTLLEVRPDGTTATLYSGLGSASAVVEDGRGVLALIDGSKGTLFLDDRRTGVYTFGSQALNTTSALLAGSITNDGNQTLGGIGGIPGDSTFKQVVETGACVSAVPDAGTSLALGASCKLDYTFTPSSSGPIAESGTEQDSTYTAGSDFTYRTINFSGIGIAPSPSATLTPGQVAFGNVPAGTVSPTQVATLTNVGTGTLAITSITLPGSSDFSQTNNCLSTLAAGASCSITITYSPTTATQATATLSVSDNSSPNTLQTSAITGTGTTVPATLTPATANFGTQAAATTSAPTIFTLANSNAAAIQQTGITLTGSGAAQFQIASTNCTATLAAKSSCTVNVVFVTGSAASGGATYSASLNIATSLGALISTITGSQTVAPQAALTPATASFGSVAIGETSSQAFVLTNTGTAGLTINGASTASAAFPIASTTCGTSLAAGSSCSYTVNFTPAATGPQSATLTLTDSAGTQTSTLAGTGLATALSITPATITFPSTLTGQTSAAMSATLTNVGNAPVYLTTPQLTDATDFAQSNNCSGLLATGASCTVVFTFTPKAGGPFTATYTIADLNNSSHPVSVALSGASAAPVTAMLTPATLSFFSTTSFSAATQTATLTNTGTTALAIASITLGGTNPASFTQSNNCGATLAAGATCVVTLGLVNTTVGTFAATLTVADNATAGNQTSTLAGTVTGVPQPVLTPSTLLFAATNVGTATAAQTLTLSNTGTAPLGFSGISFFGTNVSSFAQTNACPATLAIGASCAISVTCTPAASGALSATLAANFPSPITQVFSALSCTGVTPTAPQAAFTPATAAFGTVTVGTTSSTQVFTLSNAGTGTLAITSISLGGTNASSFSIPARTCGTSLAAATSCTVTVAFVPTAGAALSATLSVVDAVGTQSSALSGTGSLVAPDFTIAASPAAQSTYRGASVTYSIQLASLLAGNPYNSAVTLSASNLPSGTTATFSPATVTPGASPQTATMTIVVPPLSAQTRPGPLERHAPGGITLAFAALGMGLGLRARRRMPRLLAVVLMASLACLGLALTGCGMGNGFAIPTSTSSVTVTATGTATAHSTTVTLTIQ